MNGCATDRSQFRVTTFDQDIGSRNPVRIIDVFSDALDLKKIGIYETTETAQGRPKAASERDLLKLHIYGAMKKIHSSRELEEACRINVEVRWLIRGQTPKHTVISEFRSKNIKCIRKVYLMFTDMLIRYLSTIIINLWMAVNSRQAMPRMLISHWQNSTIVSSGNKMIWLNMNVRYRSMTRTTSYQR